MTKTTQTTEQVKAELIAGLTKTIDEAATLACREGYVCVFRDGSLFMGVDQKASQYRLMGIANAFIFKQAMTAALECTRWNDMPETANVQLTVMNCREAAELAAKTATELLALVNR